MKWACALMKMDVKNWLTLKISWSVCDPGWHASPSSSHTANAHAHQKAHTARHRQRGDIQAKRSQAERLIFLHSLWLIVLFIQFAARIVHSCFTWKRAKSTGAAQHEHAAIAVCSDITFFKVDSNNFIIIIRIYADYYYFTFRYSYFVCLFGLVFFFSFCLLVHLFQCIGSCASGIIHN